MKIALLEPIGVSKEVIDELSAPITEKGHEFVYYDTKTTDPAELAKRSEGCDIVMIANNPYPTEVVEKADALKMLSVAFTGIDHIGTDKCKEKNIMICNAAGYSNPVSYTHLNLTVRICDRHFLFQICDNILRVL